MKVSLLIDLIKHNPDDDIMVLWWEKESFDYLPDEEVTLTKEAWLEICNEFDQWNDAGNDVSEWIADAVIEKAEKRCTHEYEAYCPKCGVDSPNGE